MSINWQLDDVRPAPGILVFPPDAASLDEADAACELWEYYTRKTLDVSQRLAVRVMMAQTATGRWAASTTGREAPRQTGKGDEIEVVELWDMVQRGAAIMHTVHDAVLLATETQRRMLGVLEGHADLRRLVTRKWQGTGQQMIEMRNGGVIWYRTRTGGGGRGVDKIDRLVVDEAQHAEEAHLAAITPTMLAAPDPQMNVLGTAALAGKSQWWWTIRKRALLEAPGRFGYVGHTAERPRLEGTVVVSDPVDVQDRKLWYDANPSLVAGRGTGIEFFEEQLFRLGSERFAREHLGVWDPPDGAETGGLIGDVLWLQLADKSSTIESHHQVALDVSPDRQWASFAAAGRRRDGHVHVEIVDRRPKTGWVIARAEEIAANSTLPIRIAEGSPASSMITQLRERKVPVVEVARREVVAGVGQLQDLAEAGTVHHLGDNALADAVRHAVLSMSGDTGTLSRRSSRGDISPLVAVVVALTGVPAAVRVPALSQIF